MPLDYRLVRGYVLSVNVNGTMVLQVDGYPCNLQGAKWWLSRGILLGESLVEVLFCNDASIEGLAIIQWLGIPGAEAVSPRECAFPWGESRVQFINEKLNRLRSEQ